MLSHLCSFIYTLYVSKLGWRKIGPVPHVCQQMIILITASAQHFVPCEEAHFPFLIYYFWEEGLDLFPRSVMFFIWALGELLLYATSWGYLLSFKEQLLSFPQWWFPNNLQSILTTWWLLWHDYLTKDFTRYHLLCYSSASSASYTQVAAAEVLQ